jgi:hypothetical protein
MARFSELFRCSGVDESPKAPGMVVPFGGDDRRLGRPFLKHYHRITGLALVRLLF